MVVVVFWIVMLVQYTKLHIPTLWNSYENRVIEHVLWKSLGIIKLAALQIQQA
jgi:hypothetical protein